MLTRRTVLSAALSPLAACTLAAAPVGTLVPGRQRTLSAYRSDDEMAQALERWRQRTAALPGSRLRRNEAADAGSVLSPQAEGALPMPPPTVTAFAQKSAAPSTAAGESITNVQTAGVDEGGIVKRAGDYLVVLRRGRLFTVRVGGDALQAAALLPAYAPGIDAGGAWYDELLISGSTVVVVGYSHARGGTEIGLFSLGDGGALRYRATYHLRSFDYYSSRNYASRLVGNRLLFYTPTLLQPGGLSPMQSMPAVRRWQGASVPEAFERILPATRIYRSDDEFEPGQPLALHTVTACELGDGEMRCESTAVLGPSGRVFYVSQGSVYVWTSTRPQRGRGLPTEPEAASAVFRMPLDGSAPSALKTAGVPIDQMSFLEGDDGHLNVLLRASGSGEGMWGSERAAPAELALLRVPLAQFGDGSGSAGSQHYRKLPPPGGLGPLQNRYVGNWLLWGGGPEAAWALPFAAAAADRPAIALAPGHAIERIEALGAHALLVGNAGTTLRFSRVRLGTDTATLEGGHEQAAARQGETRSHGFFFRPTGDDGGLLGLPVVSPETMGGFLRARQSAAVLFLRQQGNRFSTLGELKAGTTVGAGRGDDACIASCTDWYGNARPIFIGERVFALMGYELVEGRLVTDGAWRSERIEERRRIDFRPGAARRDGRYSPFG